VTVPGHEASTGGVVSLESPLQAVRAVGHAVERRSDRAVMRVLSRDSRARIDAEVAPRPAMAGTIRF
jgi:hypothetical protein